MVLYPLPAVHTHREVRGEKSVKYWHAMRERFMGVLDCSLCGVIKRKKKLVHYSLTAVVPYLNKVPFTITLHH